jgi:hypothetical protein
LVERGGVGSSRGHTTGAGGTQRMGMGEKSPLFLGAGVSLRVGVGCVAYVEAAEAT